MAIQKSVETVPDSPDRARVREIAEKYNQDADKRERDFSKVKSTTEVLGFRVPMGERTRIRLAFARHGLTLSEGLKKSVYEYLKTLDGAK